MQEFIARRSVRHFQVAEKVRPVAQVANSMCMRISYCTLETRRVKVVVVFRNPERDGSKSEADL